MGSGVAGSTAVGSGAVDSLRRTIGTDSELRIPTVDSRCFVGKMYLAKMTSPINVKIRLSGAVMVLVWGLLHEESDKRGGCHALGLISFGPNIKINLAE